MNEITLLQMQAPHASTQSFPVLRNGGGVQFDADERGIPALAESQIRNRRETRKKTPEKRVIMPLNDICKLEVRLLICNLKSFGVGQL